MVWCVPFVLAFQTPQFHGLPNILDRKAMSWSEEIEFGDWDSKTQEICLAPPKLGPVLESWS